jgi:hypothetical protein
MRRGEGVYVTTGHGARLVCDLTGGLSAPRMPDATDGRWLGQLRHDLTVPEVERWLLARARRKGHDGTRFLTGRQLARGRAMALPPHLRRGGAPLGYMPDGELVLPTEERIAVEVELHDKAERLADKLARYRDADYAEVLWLVPAAGVERPLADAIDRAGATDLMAVERLPEELLYAA